MKFLLDTHMLLWAHQDSTRLSPRARGLMTSPDHELLFSSVSIAEIAIKRALQRPDFTVQPEDIRADALASSYLELAFLSVHAVEIVKLPPIHKDPFDRMLVAQAIAEGLPLLTMDKTLAGYPGPIWMV